MKTLILKLLEMVAIALVSFSGLVIVESLVSYERAVLIGMTLIFVEIARTK